MSRLITYAKYLGCCFAVAASLSGAPAESADGTRQYRAAVTHIFLSQYHAMPVFRLNPLFPGDVVRLSNETKYLTHDRCYGKMQVGTYSGITDFRQGVEVSTSIDLTIKGELLNKKIAALAAGGNIKFKGTSRLMVSPLSVDNARPDTNALWRPASGPPCNEIRDMLDGTRKGFGVVAAVLHGKILLSFTADLSGSLNANAQGELIKSLAKAFSVSEADIDVAGSTVSFSTSGSPAAMTLAFVPEGYNRDEMARITHYLQGKRGADLEIAVENAITAGDVSMFRAATLRISSLLGDEIKNKEIWAENLLAGGKLTAVSELRKPDTRDVDFNIVGVYGAAMELIRDEIRQEKP